MDVKEKSKEDFENYYYTNYNNIISNYYEMDKNKKKLIAFSRIAISILGAILIIFLFNPLKTNEIIKDYYPYIIVFCFVFIIIIDVMLTYIDLKKVMKNLSNYIIKDIFAFISNNYVKNIVFEPKMRVSEESLQKMELFNLDIVKYNGNNYIKVPYNNNNMVFSDMKIYYIDTNETKKSIYKEGKKYIRKIRKKRKNIIFKGIYIGASLNKKNTNQIYLIPNNFKDILLQSKIMNYIKYRGQQISLENLEFSKKYKVYCDDEIQARYILSLSLMERINKLDEIFKDKKYIVFKEGKRFAICIENISIEDIKNITLPIFRNKDKEIKILANIFEKLNNLFKIYYILDLGNDIYTKYMNIN